MNSLLQVQRLKKTYYQGRATLFSSKRAVCPVNNINLSVVAGKNLGIAGESGSGKTSLARLLGGLEKPDRGTVSLLGQSVQGRNKKQRLQLRLSVQYVFQELYEALNPKRTILQTLQEPLVIHKKLDRQGQIARVFKIMEQVGLGQGLAAKYPHELSGGQRQRASIARSLMLDPKLIIADEPVSALDVSVQAQILNLLVEIQKKLAITYIVISHNLAILRYLCDQIIIYYAGEVIEYHPQADFLFESKGLHPYTKKLIEASFCDVDNAPKDALPPEETAALNLLSPNYQGCRYYQHCPLRSAVCQQEKPLLKQISGAMIACHNIN